MSTAPLSPLPRGIEMSRVARDAINGIRKTAIEKIGVDPLDKGCSTTKSIIEALTALAVEIENLKCLLDDQNDQLGELRDTVEAL